MDQRQRVLVFGGVGGIGEALVRQLANDGVDVFLTSRSLERAQDLAAQISQSGVGAATGLACDAHQPETIAAAVEAASGDGASLNGLAYCIGSIDLKPLARTTPEAFAQTYALNVIGAAMAVKAGQSALKAARGSIVLFSTIAAQQGFPNHTLIAAAKGGLEGLTVSLAAELAPDVRVNAIAPSLTDTPLAAGMLSSEALAKSLAQQHPLHRLGTPDDSAALAAFLLSQASSWMTGQIIGVDGGRGKLRVGRG